MGGTQGTGFSKRGMGGDSGSLVELRWAVISVEPREPEVGGDMGGASRNEGGQRRGQFPELQWAGTQGRILKDFNRRTTSLGSPRAEEGVPRRQ